MSIHLFSTAAMLPLKPSEKLVLLCLCDNARDPLTRLALPGLDDIITWSCVSRPRVFAVLKTLDELRLAKQVKRGQKYQRAEFVVFPDGCCAAHPAVDLSCGRDAESPVESLAGETLNGPQGLVLSAQGLAQDGSGSCGRDALRKNPLQETPDGFSSSNYLRSVEENSA